MSTSDFDELIERYHLALDAIVKGDPGLYKEIYSEEDDIVLGNPFGPFVRGRSDVEQAMERAASHYREGRATGFETVAKYVGPEFAYLVEVERLESKIGGRDDLASVALRVTSIFRSEGGTWKLVHRHADPITSIRNADSVIQT